MGAKTMNDCAHKDHQQITDLFWSLTLHCLVKVI